MKKSIAESRMKYHTDLFELPFTIAKTRLHKSKKKKKKERQKMDLINGPAPFFLVYFQIGDRIIEVDGVDLRHSTHERAVEVIQAAGNPVCLLVQSLVHLVRPPHDQENIDVTTLPLPIQIHCHRLT